MRIKNNTIQSTNELTKYEQQQAIQRKQYEQSVEFKQKQLDYIQSLSKEQQEVLNTPIERSIENYSYERLRQIREEQTQYYSEHKSLSKRIEEFIDTYISLGSLIGIILIIILFNLLRWVIT